MRSIALALLAVTAALGQSTKQPLQVTSIPGINSTWPGEGSGCPGTIDNRSSVSRRNWYHSVVASGSGSWSVTIRYSNVSCTGPWTSYPGTASINQASNPSVAFALDVYTAPASFINILITGNAVATYSGQNQLPLSTANGSIVFPCTVPQGCTGLTNIPAHSVIIGNGTSTPNTVLPGPPGTALTSNGPSSDPSYQSSSSIFPSLSYSFTPQAPGGSLIASGINQPVNMAPCPPGLSGADTNHWVYLSGGTGGAEAVLITGGTCTPGASSGTITLTPANGHSGAWTVGPASSGIAEAEYAACTAGGGLVSVPAGSFNVYAPIAVGNGTSSTVSSCSGVQLIGFGSGTGDDEINPPTFTTKLIWGGATSGSVFKVFGPMTRPVIKDMIIDCISTACVSGLISFHGVDFTYDHLVVRGNSGFGIDLQAFQSHPNLALGSFGDLVQTEVNVQRAGGSCYRFGLASANPSGGLDVAQVNGYHTRCLCNNDGSGTAYYFGFSDALTLYNPIEGFCHFSMSLQPPAGSGNASMFPGSVTMFNPMFTDGTDISSSWSGGQSRISLINWHREWNGGDPGLDTSFDPAFPNHKDVFGSDSIGNFYETGGSVFRNIVLSNGANQSVVLGTGENYWLTGPTASFSIGGFSGSAPGRHIRLRNNTNFAMTFTSFDSGTGSPNWVALANGESPVIPPGGTAELVYFSDGAAWTIVSPLPFSSSQTDIRSYGAMCDGTTDDTAALQNSINHVSAVGGGTVYIPASIPGCRVNGQITIPNDSASPVPGQKTIRILGNGNATNTIVGVQAVSSGSTLDMRFSGSNGKLVTFGAGQLEIGFLNIRDSSASNSTPFVYVTNTAIYFHDNSVIGSVFGPTTTQDVIILGGTTTTRSGTASSPFGGYGTRIEGNFFDRIQRAVYGRVFANGVVVRSNTISSNGGGAAAIEFNGNAGSGELCDGGSITDNLIELAGYNAAIKMDYSANFGVINNMLYDYDGFSVYGVLLGTHTSYNMVISGTHTLGGPSYLTDQSHINNLIYRDQAAGGYTNIMPFVAFANLPSPVPANPGAQVYCYNCTTASTCSSGGGTGHVATSNGSIWKCD